MRSLSRTAIVRRALVVVVAGSSDPIHITDLYRAAGVSERTLRNAFHHVLGISPKQYLIRRRLEEAHRALLEAHGARGAVTRVATTNGFFELGRFAGTYRHTFGVLPSITLREAGQHKRAS